MSIEGTLEERGLGQVFSALARRDRTGILTVQGAGEIIAISFLEGEVVSADALNLTLEDGLGAVLADLELVAPEDFAGLAAEHQAGGGRVGELLVERGYLTRPQLLGAIRDHTYRLCREVLSWSEGEYKFYQGEEVSYEPGLTPIPVTELMHRVSRELGRGEHPEIAFPGPGWVYARSATAFDGGSGSRAGESEPPAVAELGDEARDLFARLDGVASGADLARATGLQEFVVCYLLHRFERQQIIELVRSDPHPIEVVVPLSGAELPEVPIEVPQPPRRRDTLDDRLARLRRSMPKLDAVAFDWLARLAGVALLISIAVSLAAATAGGAPVTEGLEIPPTAHAALRHQLDLERIHRASRVFFLLYGRFPEDLGSLDPLRLRLAEVDDGRALDYSATAVSYVAAWPTRGGIPAGTETGTIAGDFLLDPDFGVDELSDKPPLVLLD